MCVCVGGGGGGDWAAGRYARKRRDWAAGRYARRKKGYEFHRQDEVGGKRLEIEFNRFDGLFQTTNGRKEHDNDEIVPSAVRRPLGTT